jgi:chaperone required for assembly of F1-ATPase
MSEWKAKRFWTETRVADVPGGHTVQLDGRPVKTPAKAALVMPTRAMAEAAAAEWEAQQETIDPISMPVTRSVNAAIDKVAHQFAEVADMLAAYGDSDLTCYRADGPEGLVARQTAGWDPLLDWAADTFDARLIPVQGVVHQAQNPQALGRLRAPIDAMSPFELTAMHDLISLSGSLVIGLAASAGLQPPAALWRLSRIDEDWQVEQWGEDEEATKEAEIKRVAFHAASRFLELSRA